MSDEEIDEGYNEFIEEYGQREDWCIYDLEEWDDLLHNLNSLKYKGSQALERENAYIVYLI